MMHLLDANKLISSAPAEVLMYLRSIANECQDEDVSQEIIELVEIGALPPAIYGFWLSVSPSATAIRHALQQKISSGVRKLAIKSLQKVLLSQRWKEVLEGLGGTSGLLDVFKDLSVREVKDACLAIVNGASRADQDEKRERLTELFKALLSRYFPDSRQRNQDQRSLRRHYEHLLPACTTELVSYVLHSGLEGNIRKNILMRLLQTHTRVLQALALRFVLENDTTGEQWLQHLLYRYPVAPLVKPGFSAPMEFSLTLLQRIVGAEKIFLSEQRVVNEIIAPLLKRAVKKRTDLSVTQQIVNLSVEYFKNHQNTARELNLQSDGIIHMVALCWSRQPDRFENALSLLLSLLIRTSWRNIGFNRFCNLLPGIADTRQYDLLNFCFRVVVGIDLDIKGDLKNAHGSLSYRLLHRMRPDVALGLFTRLRSARGDEELVERSWYSSSILNLSRSPNDDGAEVDLFHVFLLQRNGQEKEAEEIAAHCVETRKKSAMSSPKPEQRAFWAQAALGCAIASGSLELYKEVLNWARRFVRDPLVVPQLYRNYGPEAIALLSGITEPMAKNPTLDGIRTRIQFANQILMGLFDTACSALREPAFAAQHWYGTLNLFLSVVQKRIKCSPSLKQGGLSDLDVFNSVWKPTIDMLITVETKALYPDYEALDAHRVRGILSSQTYDRYHVKNGEPATYHFLDELAKARDELWQRHRPTVYPAAAMLPPPFPRGLPIQYLTGPFIIQTPDLQSLAPYIASRVEATLLPSPEVALTPFPKDEETVTAVGVLVDSYVYAMTLFLPEGLDEAEKTQRVTRISGHALGPLSQSRMTPDEAARYWEERFPPNLVPQPEPEDWPVVPAVDQPDQVEEWNPRPPKAYDNEARKLDPLTWIDLSKSIFLRYDRNPSLQDEQFIFEPLVPKASESGIWSWTKTQKAMKWAPIREGQILSAILYLDSFNSAEARVLAQPFPSESLVRYPAVYLDEEFLSNESLERYAAIDLLESHIQSVPARLLAQLVENALQTLDTTDPSEKGFVNASNTALRLLKLLGRSDRPALASELAVRTIVNQPEASGWHRDLLSRGYFRTLPASNAQECLSLLANAIIAKLDEQNKKREQENGKPSDPSEQQQKPIVKVTTVKFLAQLLGDTEFIPQDFALSILTNLIHKASHVDIRRAVLSSLLSMFDTATSEQGEAILKALETFIPLAGNIRERRPISEAEWADAETKGALPEFDPYLQLDEAAPVLSSLLAFIRRQPEELPTFPHREALIQRIIVPVVDSLKRQMARWASLFLSKHGFDPVARQELNIPPLAGDRAIFTEVISCASSHLPASLLEELVAYLSFNIAPPKPIKSLNKKLKDDPALRRQPDVRIWLARFGIGPSIVSVHPVFHLPHLLSTPSQLQGAITPKLVQQQFLTLYTTVLWHDNTRQSNLAYMTNPLWTFSPGAQVRKDWGEYIKPIVDALILYTEGLRTKDWAEDPKRHPAVLPDTFRFRMWLLQYAAQHSAELGDDNDAAGSAREAHCKAFAGRVAKIVEQFPGTLYHGKFAQLKTALEYVRGDDRLRVACYLGDVLNTKLSWLTVLDHLRVELAAELLEKRRGQSCGDEGLKERVKELKKSWWESGSEEVRRVGFRVQEEETSETWI